VNIHGTVVSLAPTRSITLPSASLNMITSTVMVHESGMLTVTVHESGTLSPMQTHSSPFWEGSPGATSASASALASGVGRHGG
jgi:hypothetical protein